MKIRSLGNTSFDLIFETFNKAFAELTKTVEELAIHVANFSINEQDYSVLLRYFSFGLCRLKSYHVRFGINE